MNRIYAAAALTALTGLAAPAHAEAPVLRAAVIGGLERTDSAPGSGAEPRRVQELDKAALGVEEDPAS